MSLSFDDLIKTIDDFGPSIEEAVDALPEGLSRMLDDQELYTVTTWQDYHEPMHDRVHTDYLPDANVVGSAVRGLFATHRPILDIDGPATLEPSAFAGKAKLSFQIPDVIAADGEKSSMLGNRVRALTMSTNKIDLGGLTTAFDDARGSYWITLWVDASKVWLIPSSTEGHSHLYIDLPMIWDDYRHLLETLADIGILEPGYVSASVSRGQTMLRLPWVKKVF